MGIGSDVMEGLGLSDPVVRIGVTGLSRAGKTVFITSLVANMLERGRMQSLRAAADGRLKAVWLQPQPDDTIPRFDFERHLATLTGPEPRWPDGTRHVSQLRLSLRLQGGGLFAGLRGARTLHLDIVDYPGEWLLDLRLMERDFAQWSAEVLDRVAGRPGADRFLAALSELSSDTPLSEPLAQQLADIYTAHLNAAREAGWSDCTPGRFLIPGELAGSPALTFAPLPPALQQGKLGREFRRRFDAYKARVVRPFFRDHFARIDRQVVLVDVLGAIHQGPRAVEDMRRAMADILAAFRPGRAGWLAQILGTQRVERILFAATKADHLHQVQHNRLTAILSSMLREARDRADFQGARTEAMAIAALRATTEDMIAHGDEELPAVRGRLLDGRQAAFYAGELPADPSLLLHPARQGADGWLDSDYAIMNFAPAPLTTRPGDGPPHIRLDRAAEFLIGDRL
ncbi:YcjX family protein [Paracoccus liaowanqingii]|uniref:YcjX family protein n=1 Tax=Paracoccus liaowanqingii TaxID=2560053 RepID=A0A4P7HHT5_9RHOB|nr:YcjX family protein [Paracoccus liaowanqingii]QBX33594.1 YcjX family protein [Paracoccus liaowanqingii]